MHATKLSFVVEDPKVKHASAVKWLVRHSKGVQNKGTTFTLDEVLGLEVFVNADFVGNWDKNEVAADQDTVQSRHGHTTQHNGCPVVWKSQLWQEATLSSTKSKHAGMSCALRDATPVVELLKEMGQHSACVPSATAQVHCRAFKDNSVVHWRWQKCTSINHEQNISMSSCVIFNHASNQEPLLCMLSSQRINWQIALQNCSILPRLQLHDDK